MGQAADPLELESVETYLDQVVVNASAPQGMGLGVPSGPRTGPVALVETAFLASTAALIWLVNTYFPPGPILRIFFPLPMALVYLRWGARAAWMSALVAGLLLAVLMGPPRSLLFLMPYALMGVQLGFNWRRQTHWYGSIALGTLLGSLGFFFRLWLMSILLGEDLWVYLTTQVTQMLNWGLDKLVNLGVLSVGVLSQANVEGVQLLALAMVLLSNGVYLFTVHLAAWLLFERLGMRLPEPPGWVQSLLDDPHL
jgi:uncharacterized protein YybS (DUF2232 family)